MRYDNWGRPVTAVRLAACRRRVRLPVPVWSRSPLAAALDAPGHLLVPMTGSADY